MKTKKILAPSILIILIIIISNIFHYKIHIEDAITLEALSEYGIAISIWRVMFEPIIGILLYFNRALYSIDELLYTLVWTLVLFLIYSIFKLVVTKEDKKKFMIAQVVNVPLLLGLWFTTFVVIVFIPLPNNTIINNSTQSVLVTTHAHSEYSHDGLISLQGLWEWHKRNGFDAFFITEHNNHHKSLDYVHAQRNNEFPIKPLVMCGEEFSGTNHLSLLGLKRKFSTRGYSDSTAIDSTRASDGAVIVNHWFDGKRKSMAYYSNLGVDGFEIANSATERVYDRSLYKEMKEYCESNNLIMNGGVDFHGYGNACSIWNAFEIPNWDRLDPDSKEKAILEIINNRDQSKLKVLFYKDRSFYDSQNLLFSPILTLINYFRTLNVFQITSWAIWILFYTAFRIKVCDNLKIKNNISANMVLSVTGVLSGLFLIVLGFIYFLRIKDVVGYTEMYDEYSIILFYVGSALVLYSSIAVYFRCKTERLKC